MRIALVNLTGGGLSGGGHKTLTHLVQALRDHSDVERLDVYVPPSQAKIDAISELGLTAWPAADRFRRYPWLREQLRRSRADVVYIPNSTWFDAGGLPTVIMIRNMEAMKYPFRYNRPSVKLRNGLRRSLAKRACRRADRVIAVSGFVKEFIVQSWGLSDKKVGLAYHGVEPPPGDDQLLRPAQLHDDDKGKFWMTAGSLVGHRGVEDLIEALALLPPSSREHDLVVAGQPVPGCEGYLKDLQKIAREKHVGNRLRWLGHVQSAELSWCYLHCRGFVMTSRVEACPNVVLEAMSHGCVSISVDCPPMPEFFLETASYFPAGDARRLSREMQNVDQMTSAERSEIQEKARRRAQQFTWSTSAAATVNQLKMALDGGSTFARQLSHGRS